MEFLAYIYYGLGFALGVIIHLVLHELGHLAAGQLTGYRLVSFRLLNLLWARDENGKLRLTKTPAVGGIAGQCLMAPDADESGFRYKFYNAGGGLANLILGLAFLLPLFWLSGGAVRSLLFGVGFAGLWFGLLNLIPIRASVPNDGANLREAGKCTEAAHGFYLILKINADMATGKFLADFPADTFAFSSDANSGNYLVANTMLLRAAQLEEQGNFGESYAILSAIQKEKLPQFYAMQVTLNLMFHELVHFGDAASTARARERTTDQKLFQKLPKIKHPAFLPFQAAKAALLDGNIGKTTELLSQAQTQLAALQNPGEVHSIQLMLKRFAARVNQESGVRAQDTGNAM